MNKELTGTNIEITNAGERQLSSFQMEGKSVQNGTPEPNVPVEIESVGYTNLLELENPLSVTGIKEWIPLTLEPGTYTVSIQSLISEKEKSLILFWYEDDTSISTSVSNTETKKTITLTKKVKAYNIYSSITYADSVGATTIFNNLMLTKGDQERNYIPGNKYGIEVEMRGRNVVPFIDQNFDLKGINYYVKNGSLFLNGTSSGETSSADPIFKQNLSFTLPGGTYVLSHKTGVSAVYLYDASTGYAKAILGKNIESIAFTTQSTTTFYIGFYQYQVSYDNADTKIMICNGREAYQPYLKNKYTYVLDEPLRSLPNSTCDILAIENNKLYVDRYVGGIVLNGSEAWRAHSSIANTYLLSMGETIGIQTQGRCDRFKEILSSDFGVKDGIYTKYTSSIYITHLESETVEDFKTWLSTHPTQVIYEHQTPVNQKLGDVDMPTTTYGTNYITTNTDIQPRLAIEYFKGFSYKDKEAIKNGTVAIKSRIIVNTEPQMVLTENDSIKDWEYCDERYVPQQGFIGQFVARTLSGNLQDISDDFNIENHEIELQLGIVNIATNTETWYSFGKFLVTSPEGDEVTDNTEFEAMDYTKKFNVDFDGNYTSENFPESYNAIVAVDETTGEPKGSVTALWLARYTCEQAGVPFGQNTFTNADYIIDFNPYQAGESCRDVMKDIAKLAFSWVRVDVDNKCYIDFKESSEDYGDEYNVFTNDEYYSLETKKEIYGPINRIYIGMSNIDGESIIVAEDKEDIEANGEKALYIYDNQLTYSPELRALIADNHSANKLLGLTYTHLTTETIGHPWLNGKEFISVIGMEDNECKTYPFNRIIKFNGHIKSTLDSMGESEVEATLGYESDVVKNAKNAMVLVKKHEGEIELLTTDVTIVQDNIKNNYYTKEDTNKTISNATSGLTNIYTRAGGNNRFRNTGLHFKEADGFEYWEGLVEVIAEINSATQTAMLLQNGSVSQMVSNLPNGKYTVSFKYEELIESSSAYVLINSTRYDLAGSGTFKQTIDVNTNNIEIDFNCDTNGGFKIYELMGNVGETALVWTQHPDEIMTDTVNISKGITITSSKTDAIFKAGADGIRIENRSKNTTTEFLENGMSTNDAEIKGQAKISGSLFTKVGNQTWISGL